LGLPDGAREIFDRLNVETVGDLLALPAEGVRRRFSETVWRWYRRARGDLERPVASGGDRGPVALEINFDEPLTVETRLVFAVKRRLNPVLGGLDTGPRGVRALELLLVGPTGDSREMRVAPARPTARAPRLMELFRLKLESGQREQSQGNAALPERGIVRVEIQVEIVRDEPNQMHLFEEGPSRDLDKANRALARLRAEFGESSVVQGRAAPGHLPEAQATWEPFDEIEDVSSDAVESAAGTHAIDTLVRRMWRRPKPVQLPGPGPSDTELPDGQSTVLAGPYFVDGAWWAGGVRRAYHYAERPDGRLWWIYYDLRRGQWYVQGLVE
jgi:protein ImuB